jgi:hypothetical protein
MCFASGKQTSASQCEIHERSNCSHNRPLLIAYSSDALYSAGFDASACLAVRIYDNAESIVIGTAKIGGYLSIATKTRVQTAIYVITNQGEVDTRAVEAAARHQNLAQSFIRPEV